jgi:hypothetical protein
MEDLHIGGKLLLIKQFLKEQCARFKLELYALRQRQLDSIRGKTVFD